MQYSTTSIIILKWGINVLVLGTFFFMGIILLLSLYEHVPQFIFIMLTIGSMMITMLGITMITPNALSLALEEYRYAIGTTSSLFGFFYYTCAALFTLGMGALHNGTLFPMPIYFGVIAFLLWVVFSRWIMKDLKTIEGEKSKNRH